MPFRRYLLLPSSGRWWRQLWNVGQFIPDYTAQHFRSSHFLKGHRVLGSVSVMNQDPRKKDHLTTYTTSFDLIVVDYGVTSVSVPHIVINMFVRGSNNYILLHNVCAGRWRRVADSAESRATHCECGPVSVPLQWPSRSPDMRWVPRDRRQGLVSGQTASCQCWQCVVK
jgi:hypothetical protein